MSTKTRYRHTGRHVMNKVSRSAQKKWLYEIGSVLVVIQSTIIPNVETQRLPLEWHKTPKQKAPKHKNRKRAKRPKKSAWGTKRVEWNVRTKERSDLGPESVSCVVIRHSRLLQHKNVLLCEREGRTFGGQQSRCNRMRATAGEGGNSGWRQAIGASDGQLDG